MSLVLLAACRGTGEEDLRKGNVFFANQDYARAEQHYAAALKINPKSTRAMEGLGNVAYEQQDVSGAIEWYQKAVDTNPNAIASRHKLAVALSSSGQPDAAIAVLEKTIEYVPDDAFAYHALGGLLHKKGEHERAEKMQVQAITVDEDYHAARYALAMTMIDAGRTEEAEQQLTRLVRSGQRGLAEYGFARIAAKAGKPARAAEHLERVLATDVARPERILEDDAFTDTWSDPAMQRIRVRLSETSTTGK